MFACGYSGLRAGGILTPARFNFCFLSSWWVSGVPVFQLQGSGVVPGLPAANGEWCTGWWQTLPGRDSGERGELGQRRPPSAAFARKIPPRPPLSQSVADWCLCEGFDSRPARLGSAGRGGTLLRSLRGLIQSSGRDKPRVASRGGTRCW